MPSEPRERGSESEDLYVELQAHLEDGRWIESITLCHRILDAEPGYRDVAQILETCRHQLASEREQSRTARDTWRGAMAPVLKHEQPRSRRWLWVLLAGFGALLLGAVVIAALSRFREQLPLFGRRSEPSGITGPAEIPPVSVPVTGAQFYTNEEGRFLLKYPEGWVVQESPAEGRSLRIVMITPQAGDEPERITIVFGPGSGQSAEQVWVTGLGFIQSVHGDKVEDWYLGEAFSMSVGGHHARQIPFRYTHIRSENDWQGLVTGVVYDSMNYAVIAEAPASRWPWAWSFFEGIMDSMQFR